MDFKGLVFPKALCASKMLILLPSCRDTSLLISDLSNQVLLLIQTVSSLSQGLGHRSTTPSRVLDRLEIGCGHHFCFSLEYCKKGIKSTHELTRSILQGDLYKMLLFKNRHLSIMVKTLWRRRGLPEQRCEDPSATLLPERHLLNW